MISLPEEFTSRLKNLYDKIAYDKVVASFSLEKPVAVRVNTLKASVDEITSELDHLGIKYSHVPWYKEALMTE